MSRANTMNIFMTQRIILLNCGCHPEYLISHLRFATSIYDSKSTSHRIINLAGTSI